MPVTSPEPAPPDSTAASGQIPTPKPGDPSTTAAPASSEVPLSPPKPTVEYNPQFSPPVTHDLRTNRPEAARLAELAPVDPQAPDPFAAMPMSTIATSELHKLQTQAGLNILALDFSRSELPAEEALRIGKAFREGIDGVTPAHALPAETVSAQIQKTLAPTPSKRSGNRLVFWGGVAMVVLLAGLGGFSTGRDNGYTEGVARMQQETLVRRGFFPVIGGFNTAVYQSARLVQRRLLWVTTEPMNGYIWGLIGELTKAGRQVVVVVIGDNASISELKRMAQMNRAELYHVPVRINHCDLVQVDDSTIIDGSSDVAVYSSDDPKDVALWNRSVGKQLFDQARIVIRGPRPTPPPENQ